MALKEKQEAETPLDQNNEPALKKLKRDSEDASFAAQVSDMKNKALEILVAQMNQGTEAIYQDLYGEHWREGMRIEQEKLVKAQKERMEQVAALKESEAKRREKAKVSLTGNGVYLDDFNPRY